MWGIFGLTNMANLSPTIPINISRDPGKLENVYIGVDCSPDEIKEYTKLFKEFCDIFPWLYEEIPSIDLLAPQQLPFHSANKRVPIRIL